MYTLNISSCKLNIVNRILIVSNIKVAIYIYIPTIGNKEMGGYKYLISCNLYEQQCNIFSSGLVKSTEIG